MLAECSKEKHLVVEKAAWAVALLDATEKYLRRQPFIGEQRVKCPDCQKSAVAKYNDPERTTVWE